MCVGGGWLGGVGVGRGSMPVMKSTQMMGPPQKLSVLADLGLHTPSSNYCLILLALQAWLAGVLPPDSAVISHTIERAKATLGKLLRDGMERIWAFPSA